MRRIENPEVRKEKIEEIKSALKSMIFPMILVLLIAVGVFVIINYQNTKEPDVVVPTNAYAGDATPIVLENKELKLTFDPMTHNFDVLVKDTGMVWKAMPENPDDDPIALSSEKERMKSLLYINYSTQSGLVAQYDSYTYSVANGIYEISNTDDSITIDYSLGKVKKTFIVPTVLTVEDYDKYFAQLDKKVQDYFRSYYQKRDINKVTKEDEKKELLENYPDLENQVLYILRSTTKDGAKATMQTALENIGYTYEDYERDQARDLSSGSGSRLVFNIRLVLRIEDDDLIVEVPFSNVENPTGYEIYTMSVLPYFGCGSQEDDGFIFVPEGGGATINFNNGRVSHDPYNVNVYGWDNCISRDYLIHESRAGFGVYGISKNNSSYICMLEDGASYASILADISGRKGIYNYVNALYSIANREKIDVGTISNTEVYRYAKIDPEEKISMRFSFIDSGSYIDMAMDYRSYLFGKNPDAFNLNSDTAAPLSVEFVGAVDKVRQIVGIPMSLPLELTTFNEAKDILQQFKNDGLENVSVKYTGWANGGVKQKVLKSVKPLSDLGGKKALNALTAKADELGYDLYLNGITEYAINSNIFNGFFSFTDSARFISKKKAELYNFSHITYSTREDMDSHYLVHAGDIIEYADNLYKAAKKYNANVSFQDLGYELSSDFYVKNTVTREAAKNSQVEFLKNAKASSDQKVMFNGCNDYSIPYADIITNMSLQGNKYTVLDDSIPFLQLVIHGYVDYTGEPINICGNDEEQILICAEYGAGLNFTLMDETSFTLQKTLYTEYYGAEYDSWYDRMLSVYNRYNSEMGHVFNQEMVDHKKLESELSMTKYADGTVVYVNYSKLPKTVNGVTVGARDYKVVK